MKRYYYPRHADIRCAADWANLGDQVFSAYTPYRKDMIIGLRGLIQRLDLGPRYERMRQAVMFPGGGGPSGDLAGHAPNPELKRVLIGNLRLNGYIFQHAGRWQTTPLTARQLHTLRLVNGGASVKQIGREFGIEPHTVRQILHTAMQQHDCSMLAHLVATSYHLGWLPTEEESVKIRLDLSGSVSLGYTTGSVVRTR